MDMRDRWHQPGLACLLSRPTDERRSVCQTNKTLQSVASIWLELGALDAAAVRSVCPAAAAADAAGPGVSAAVAVADGAAPGVSAGAGGV